MMLREAVCVCCGERVCENSAFHLTLWGAYNCSKKIKSIFFKWGKKELNLIRHQRTLDNNENIIVDPPHQKNDFKSTNCY